jgi:tetratricopeptide (TPR) repeat protein
MLMYSAAVTQPAHAARLERLAPMLRSEPDNLPLHRECVELAMRSGEYPRALEIIDARLARHPAESEALFARSNALIGLKRYEEALGVLAALEEQGITQPAVLQNIATCRFLQGQYEIAHAYAARILAAGESSPGALLIAVSSLHHLGEIDEALRLADTHLAVAERDGAFAGTCAMVYVDANQLQKAEHCAALALRANPDSVDGLIARGSVASVNLDTDRAARDFSRALEISPGNARAWLGLGLLAVLAQDFGKARELLGRATEFMPLHIGSRHALAWAHLFDGDAAGAEKHFAHALELDRNFAESHGAIAAMLAMRDEREAAEREIEIAERLDRSGASSQFARAMLIASAQGPEAGQAHIREAVRALSRQLPGTARSVLQNLIKTKSP